MTSSMLGELDLSFSTLTLKMEPLMANFDFGFDFVKPALPKNGSSHGNHHDSLPMVPHCYLAEKE